MALLQCKIRNTARRHPPLADRLGRGLVIICCLGMLSCGGGDDLQTAIDNFNREPDGEPIRATIKTTVPLAHVAAVAMAAVDGASSPEVTVATTCSSYPCPALVSLELDPQNLPFAAEYSGTVIVAGLWASRDAAILTVTFPDTPVGVSTFSVHKISTFPVMASGRSSGYTIVFADIDINIDSEPDNTIDLSSEAIRMEYDRAETSASDDAEVNLAMDAWVVKIVDADTVDDFSDDRYIVSGGGQYVGVTSSYSASATNMIQLGLANVSISNDCALNPTEGFALIQEVDVSSGSDASMPVLATAMFAFESACEGRAPVLLATGNYIASIGSTIPLNLDLP